KASMSRGSRCTVTAEPSPGDWIIRDKVELSAETVLSPVQLQVLKAKATRLPQSLTVHWAVESIARLGGYLEHRRKTPIGIQVLWKGWAKLHSLVEEKMRFWGTQRAPQNLIFSLQC
ncbi:MAG: hypothetical protein AAF327_22615, partial [Cyanobacteria bacterium P01_A01_bin.37]